ncbi:hypothetical protein EDD16DRAFT_250619 [Pisolithus croceorrhizus]|nr:hypothetical protein EDD16DRAFT_250619 [Pisolithus croceorrhizus]KAI6131715.1 hypothetical protein EV401DRAFT_373566 [Pisolithus croceorrhizus]
MPFGSIGEVIALRVRNSLSTQKRNKSANIPHDCSLAAGVRAISSPIPASNLSEESSTPDQRAISVAASSKTAESDVASWARHTSDAIQACGPVARAAAGIIPVVGSPLKNAIDGLLAILQTIDVVLLRFGVLFSTLNFAIIGTHPEQGRLKPPYPPSL